MRTKYKKAFNALKQIRCSDYNLSTVEGFGRMHKDMWDAICSAGIVITPKQALRAFTGPATGYWTLMDMADYIAKRAK